MHLRAPAILLAARAHGENAVIARLMTERHGLVAAYVAGGRGRRMRPVVIPGNRVALELSAKSDSQLPFARLELEESRAPWMTEPLPAAAIQWACTLTASALPERNPYPALHCALDGLLGAICHARSARGWLGAMVAYETLLLRETGYGAPPGEAAPPLDAPLEQQFAAFRALHGPMGRHALAGSPGDGMAARVLLGERLARMVR
ncbi:DNA repair protein RecO [Erythrobacter sp. HL-111]|uniref:DNA repair protein RecO n=1 Tax=Erythrobacter sp. HL-111 TaxID=1798193 RepID=UPI0006DAB7FD|nr:recombination protein O N-terminal domain-containing protein [Erythrobacter sp. HL-111]KPP86933.1 MAG: DNA repair protein RecO (recombination protein O) [Erythrobacteraceae bacterium HL-111]SDS17948.1 DNA replication and repair protein RecO [Erythrobacter sp. HL-111]